MTTSIALMVFPKAAGVRAEGPGVWYLEQTLVVDAEEGLPKQEVVQKVWWNDRFARLEGTAGKQTIVAILDEKSQDMVLLLPSRKSWIRVSRDEYLNVLRQRLRSGGFDPAAEPQLEPGSEGKSATGLECRWYTLKVKGKWPFEARLCVAQHAPITGAEYMGLLRRLGMEGLFGKLWDRIAGLGGVVVESEMKQNMQGQRLTTSHRLVRIERRSASDRLFSVPAGWKEITDPVFTPRKGGK